MSRTFLMCPPEYFDVAYVINPWMQGNMRNIDNRLAKTQWRGLYDVIQRHARVRLMHPEPSSPDMVFTANAGLVLERTFIVSRFRHLERQSEEPYFAEWFVEHGYDVATGPADVHFEGAGDALFDRGLPVLWLAHGHRSMVGAQAFIASRMTAKAAIEVVALELVDERFYHLDTCFCPLDGGALLYYPPAFSAASLASIEARVPRGEAHRLRRRRRAGLRVQRGQHWPDRDRQRGDAGVRRCARRARLHRRAEPAVGVHEGRRFGQMPDARHHLRPGACRDRHQRRRVTRSARRLRKGRAPCTKPQIEPRAQAAANAKRLRDSSPVQNGIALTTLSADAVRASTLRPRIAPRGAESYCAPLFWICASSASLR